MSGIYFLFKEHSWVQQHALMEKTEAKCQTLAD